MNGWKQLGLSSRIFTILFLLLFTTFGMGLTSIWYADQFNKMLNRVVVEDMAALQASRELETELANQKGFVTYYFLDGDLKWLNELAVHRRAFANWLNRARQIDKKPAQSVLLNQIQLKYEKYITDKDQVIEMYKNGDRKTGEAIHWKVRENFFELNGLCVQYMQANEINIKRVQEISQLRSKRISTVTVVFMSLSIILLILLSFIVISQVLAPIRRLSKKAAVSDVAAGSGDEVRALSKQVYGLMEDRDRTISELRQSQERLLNSEKMALCGKLATEVAHSIRNPMTSINMRLFSLKRSLDLTDFQQEDFEVVSEEMRRLDNIVRNYLEFSKPHKLKKQRMGIAQVIDMTIDLLRHRLELNAVAVIRKPSDSLPAIDADPELLKEVFVNLMINACEAMGNGGEIVISEEEAMAENIGRAVLVKVKDNGPGMSEELRNRVLEPFETTKPEGTGLGLSIAVRIVEEHGGTLELFSTEGQGTTFSLTFPVCEEV
ncbi:MAG: histidine kinase [Desulfobacteraceae bacterium]|nr:histidine kinase [Desulfobacteraceae bacterium]